jgi:protein-tyrosine phosphatase
MREAASVFGIDLSEHRSQLVTPSLLKWAQLVVYMDGGNLKRLKAFNGPSAKLWCLGSWVIPAITRIPDPNYMKKGSQEFKEVIQMIVQASRNLSAVVQP